MFTTPIIYTDRVTMCKEMCNVTSNGLYQSIPAHSIGRVGKKKSHPTRIPPSLFQRAWELESLNLNGLE